MDLYQKLQISPGSCPIQHKNEGANVLIYILSHNTYLGFPGPDGIHLSMRFLKSTVKYFKL